MPLVPFVRRRTLLGAVGACVWGPIGMTYKYCMYTAATADGGLIAGSPLTTLHFA